MGLHDATSQTKPNTKMSRYIITEGPLALLGEKELAAAAAAGFMHWSECQTEGSVLDRQFFATREEAENSAVEKSGFDEASETECAYETRSMWRDEDGDLIAADTECEFIEP